MQDSTVWWLAFATGLAGGGFLVWLWDRARLNILRERLRTHEERAVWVNQAQGELREAFEALAGRALESNAEAFLQRTRDQLDGLLQQARGELKNQRTEIQTLVQPVEKTLETLGEQVRHLEQKREGAYQGLQEQLRQLGQVHQKLSSTTVRLVESLRSPTVRGRWGEMQLRRVVEMAGMIPHVDFAEQVTTPDSRRPDLIVRLPNGGILPVDAKAPMEAFLDAMEAVDESTRKAKLDRHVSALRQQVYELGQRRYWQQFENSPDFVVLFVPNDACLSLAFERDGEFLEYAFHYNVLPSTPVTLLALLKAVAYGWQQQQVTDNARQIAASGKELFERIGVFVEHLQRTGKGLNSAVEAYNQAVGSLERRLIPSARRLRGLGVSSDEPPQAEPVATQSRVPTRMLWDDVD